MTTSPTQADVGSITQTASRNSSKSTHELLGYALMVNPWRSTDIEL